MEDNNGRESSEDRRGKGGKTVRIKIWRKRGMKESEMKKEGMIMEWKGNGGK